MRRNLYGDTKTKKQIFTNEIADEDLLAFRQKLDDERKLETAIDPPVAAILVEEREPL